MQWIITWSFTTNSTTSRLLRSAWFSQEHYCGEWYSEEDFARHIVEECYNLELEIAEYLLNKLNMKQKMMGSLANYLDYETFARELFDWDYTMGANGHVFRRVCPLSSLSPFKGRPPGRLFSFTRNNRIR